jgi:hypothetical protein
VYDVRIPFRATTLTVVTSATLVIERRNSGLNFLRTSFMSGVSRNPFETVARRGYPHRLLDLVRSIQP